MATAGVSTVDAGFIFFNGQASQGRSGLNNSTNYSSPTQIGGNSDWISINTTGYEAFAINSSYELFVWGKNNAGALGIGNTTKKSSPTQLAASSGNTWKAISDGGGDPQGTVLGVQSNGTLWGWGNNAMGKVGDKTVISRSSPVQIGALTTWAYTVNSVATGSYASVAIKADGTLWSWGRGHYFLGTNSSTYTSSPVQSGSATDWSQVVGNKQGFVLLKTNGTLWTCGGGANGKLGHGNTTGYSSPIQVGSLSTWSDITAMYNGAAAIKNDGTLWTWGSAEEGKLGQGDAISRSSPTQVGALTNWSKVHAGSYSGTTTAVKTDGTLWAWGKNQMGAVGDGTVIARSSPVQIGAEATWITSNSGFRTHFGIKTSGT